MLKLCSAWLKFEHLERIGSKFEQVVWNGHLDEIRTPSGLLPCHRCVYIDQNNTPTHISRATAPRVQILGLCGTPMTILVAASTCMCRYDDPVHSEA
jgi:hypothetical protein